MACILVMCLAYYQCAVDTPASRRAHTAMRFTWVIADSENMRLLHVAGNGSGLEDNGTSSHVLTGKSTELAATA
jgi:hypothetical protein